MIKSNSTTPNESSNSQVMSYYAKIRDTIHSLDKLIVTVIYQSITIITGCLTLSILLFEKIKNPIHAPSLAVILTIIAIFITFNSQKRIKFYSDMMVQNIKVAQKLEDLLFSDDNIKITQQIENNVKYAGIKGERIFLRSIFIFYMIEVVLLFCFILQLIVPITNLGVIK